MKHSKMNFKELKNVLSEYTKFINKLKDKEIIRTNNIIGDIGEYIAVTYYCYSKKLPNLKLTNNSNKNVDALDSKCKRYSIKTTSTSVTGSIRDCDDENNHSFDYLIIVQMTKEYELKRIFQIDWKTFYHIKKINKRTNTYYISITKDFEKYVIYQSENN